MSIILLNQRNRDRRSPENPSGLDDSNDFRRHQRQSSLTKGINQVPSNRGVGRLQHGTPSTPNDTSETAGSFDTPSDHRAEIQADDYKRNSTTPLQRNSIGISEQSTPVRFTSIQTSSAVITPVICPTSDYDNDNQTMSQSLEEPGVVVESTTGDACSPQPPCAPPPPPPPPPPPSALSRPPLANGAGLKKSPKPEECEKGAARSSDMMAEMEKRLRARRIKTESSSDTECGKTVDETSRGTSDKLATTTPLPSTDKMAPASVREKFEPVSTSVGDFMKTRQFNIASRRPSEPCLPPSGQIGYNKFATSPRLQRAKPPSNDKELVATVIPAPDQAKRASGAKDGVSLETTPTAAYVTAADLNAMRDAILVQVRQEINKAKEDIINAIKLELKRR